jgi:hypothetical protein
MGAHYCVDHRYKYHSSVHTVEVTAPSLLGKRFRMYMYMYPPTCTCTCVQVPDTLYVHVHVPVCMYGTCTFTCTCMLCRSMCVFVVVTDQISAVGVVCMDMYM